MLYTKKGDGGRTNVFGCDQKISKSSLEVGVLGELDELNSLLGVCKIKANKRIAKILEDIQNDLFVISGKKIDNSRVEEVEKIIDRIEKEIPEQKSFVVSGGTELSALLDYTRAVSRRAERRTVELNESGQKKVDKTILKYLNRLSSLLFALARLANKEAGIEDKGPRY
jgi:cob(I)alamin adenosyltransferase